jgi:hypothetical protein
MKNVILVLVATLTMESAHAFMSQFPNGESVICGLPGEQAEFAVMNKDGKFKGYIQEQRIGEMSQRRSKGAEYEFIKKELKTGACLLKIEKVDSEGNELAVNIFATPNLVGHYPAQVQDAEGRWKDTMCRVSEEVVDASECLDKSDSKVFSYSAAGVDDPRNQRRQQQRIQKRPTRRAGSR